MRIAPAWSHCLDFFGTPLVIEPSPGQLSGDTGLLPIRQFDQHIGLTRAFAETAVGGEAEAPVQGKRAEEFAKKLSECLWDRNKALAKFKECVEQLRDKLKSLPGSTYQADRRRVLRITF